jgi:hypothetical protein
MAKAQTRQTGKRPAADVSEQIRTRAYQIYVRRQSQHLEGDQTTDWLMAESQIRHELDIDNRPSQPG